MVVGGGGERKLVCLLASIGSARVSIVVAVTSGGGYRLEQEAADGLSEKLSPLLLPSGSF